MNNIEVLVKVILQNIQAKKQNRQTIKRTLTQYEHRHKGPGWNRHGGGHRRHPELQDKKQEELVRQV